VRSASTRSILILALAALAACSASRPSSAAATGIVVTLDPKAAQAPTGGSVSFTATVTGTSDEGIVWSVQEGPGGGSVTATGVYTAPAVAGTYHVVAASHADTTSQQVAAVTVAAPSVVTISPPSATVDACRSVTFTATVSGTANQGVAWSVQEGPAGGTITPAGVYTAPSTAGAFHVVATSAADPTKTSQGAVTVRPEKVLSVAVTPGSATLAANGALAFSATVTTSCGTFAAQ